MSDSDDVLSSVSSSGEEEDGRELKQKRTAGDSDDDFEPSPLKRQKTTKKSSAAVSLSQASASLTKAEAKRVWLVTDADLKPLPSTKVGRSLQYKSSDVERASLRRFGSREELEKEKTKRLAAQEMVAGSTLETHRRTLGDSVKGKIEVEKWCIGARTHCNMENVDIRVFRKLFVPNAREVTPAEFDSNTPVVVANFDSYRNLSEVFGATKLTGGTRMGSWHANKMDVVYFPATQKMRCWWTMA
jgi:hypothetical protein